MFHSTLSLPPLLTTGQQFWVYIQQALAFPQTQLCSCHMTDPAEVETEATCPSPPPSPPMSLAPVHLLCLDSPSRSQKILPLWTKGGIFAPSVSASSPSPYSCPGAEGNWGLLGNGPVWIRDGKKPTALPQLVHGSLKLVPTWSLGWVSGSLQRTKHLGFSLETVYSLICMAD